MIPKKPKYIYIYLFKYNSNFTMVYDTYMNKTKVFFLITPISLWFMIPNKKLKIVFFYSSNFTMVYDT